MSGFLDHLAGMALGNMPAGSAQICLPSRFARPSFAAATAFEVIEETEARSLAALPVIAPETAEPEGPDLRGPEMGPVAQTASRHIGRQPSPPRPARHVPPHSAKPRTAERGTETGRSLLEPLAKVGTREAEHTPRDASSPISTVAPRRAPETSQSLAPAALPVQAGRRSERRTPPLSEAAVAGRSAAMRQERPVVHVTIDRIDIRAPSPAKPNVEQRRVRPQPSVSLSDFLRGEGGGRG